MSVKIDYDNITKKARIYVVKEIIKHIETNGMNGQQELFVTFLLNHPDTIVSDILRNEFGYEMTIVLQYEFWNLKLDDFGFSVSLAFEHGEENIYIPFAAISVLNDTSDDFYLNLVPDFDERKKTPKAEVNNENSGSNIISLSAFRKEK